ncbi:MAG: hypothetical protein GY834_04340 [Bacteroidetes bacterium]|nr:hypothetical protein [Bacteroidota bacterium]
MWFKTLLIIYLILSLHTLATSQVNIENLIESHLESIVENLEEDTDVNDVLSRLMDMALNPIDINKYDLRPLLELKLISTMQYLQFKDYKTKVGRIQSIKEIQFLSYFRPTDMARIIPFIKVESNIQVSNLVESRRRFLKQKLLIRHDQIIQRKSGYLKVTDDELLENPNKSYLGTPSKILIKYKLEKKNKYRFGFVMEKDPGEVFLINKYPDISKNLLLKTPQFFDYNSAFLLINGIGIIEKLIIGDYHLQFGQGLTMWSNLAFGKSSEVTDVIRFSRGLTPNTSSVENQFFRGIALSLNLKPIDLVIFYANKNRDANVEEMDEDGNALSITSLQNTGTHRSINELLDRNSVNEKLLGGRISVKQNYFEIGASIYYSEFDAVFLPSTSTYKKFNFSGKNNACLGIDYFSIINKMTFFGEFSVSRNGGRAYLSGMSFHPNSFSKFSLLYRNYQPDYQNLYANSFSEYSSPRNENGFYIGCDLWLHANWQLQLYIDQYSFPWLKSNTNKPTKGVDFLAQLNFSKSDSFSFYLRFKNKIKEGKSAANDDWFDESINNEKANLRLNFTYKISATISFQTRIEWAKITITNELIDEGMLIFNEITYAGEKIPLKYSLRYTYFNTDTYASRIYTYEKDVLYAFSIPSFYDKGSQLYLLLNYKINDKLSSWLKISNVFYSKRESIGTGLEEILGSSKTQLKIQLSYKF